MIDRDVQIAGLGLTLDGRLAIPDGGRGLVIFAHGSGSSRFSPRNRLVARVLQQGPLATLLFDLLTPGPDLAGHLLEQVVAPTLLLVGSYDETVIELFRLSSGAHGHSGEQRFGTRLALDAGREENDMPDRKETQKGGLDRLAEVEKEIARRNERGGDSSQRSNQERDKH
jgi:hypothetical protein